MNEEGYICEDTSKARSAKLTKEDIDRIADILIEEIIEYNKKMVKENK